jgi:hypothetical protein
VLHATDYGLGGVGVTSHGPIHVGVRWSHLSGERGLRAASTESRSA